MQYKKLLGYNFEFVENINPVLDSDGRIKEFYPQNAYLKKHNTKLHKYGDGCFCKFSIHPKWSGVSGVYAYYVEDELVYIGQAQDFALRFNQGYGNIAPRACFVGGQSTNCKINKMVLESIKNNKTVSLYFYVTCEFHRIEFELIQSYKPIFNKMLKNNRTEKHNCIKKVAKINTTQNKNVLSNPSINEIRSYIEKKISISKEQGLPFIDIVSGDIHNELFMVNAYPSVCRAMKTLDGDYPYEVLHSTPSGKSSTIKFRYIIH